MALSKQDEFLQQLRIPHDSIMASDQVHEFLRSRMMFISDYMRFLKSQHQLETILRDMVGTYDLSVSGFYTDRIVITPVQISVFTKYVAHDAYRFIHTFTVTPDRECRPVGFEDYDPLG